MARRDRDDDNDGAVGVYGVLLDVSGSMRSAYAIDRSHDARVRGGSTGPNLL